MHSPDWSGNLNPQTVEQQEMPRTKRTLCCQFFNIMFVFTARHLPQLNIYPELHKASHSFAEEKSRTTNDKQLFGINGHKRDGFL